MNILEKQTLEMHNVLSFRGKMTHQELIYRSLEIERILKENNAHKSGPSVTTTFSVEKGFGGQIMDVEVYNNIYNLDNEEESNDEDGQEESSESEEEKIIQVKDYKELMNQVIRDSDNDAIYNKDDYDDESDETLND